jgi:flagellar M-ring protein FliF
MPSFIEQTTKLVNSIPPRRRVAMVAIVLAAGIGIQQFVQWQKDRGFKPIYSGLASEDAGQVVQKLKESGVEYRLSEGGGVILVPEARVAELRLEMANAGLPRSGRIGFELFDKTTFGATDFAEHVNFRRAVEGELERSVMSINEVEQARVHVSFAKDSIYAESRQPAKASVLVKLRTGFSLPPQSVLAITHLLSSAVEGLSPDQVSVLDMRGRLLSKPKRMGPSGAQDASDATMEHQQQIEKDLLHKIQLTLGPLLGEDKFRAAVSVECELTSGEQSEEIYDPTKSVMLTSQSTVDSAPSSPAGGPVSSGTGKEAASAPRPSGGTARKTENITFQTSRTVRRTTLPQGGVKNISISVLLDQGVKWEKTSSGLQKVFVPPGADTLKVIRELVTGVSGMKKERGDQLIVESLPFESTINAEPPEKTDKPVPANSLMGIVVGGQPIEQIVREPKWLAVAAGLSLVVLAAFAAVIFRVRKRKAKTKATLAAAALASGSVGKVSALPGTADSQSEADALEARKSELLLAAGTERQAMLENIRREVFANPAAFAGVVQDWLVDSGEK